NGIVTFLRSSGGTPRRAKLAPLVRKLLEKIQRKGRPGTKGDAEVMSDASRPMRKLLAANRSEIAIRIFRSAHELGIRTVAIYSPGARFALPRFKAAGAYRPGSPGEPIRAYLDIPGIVELARDHEVDAIHPGYGFLSENADFARACRAAGINF